VVPQPPPMQGTNSKLHSEQDRKDERAATKQYNEYGEEPRSAVDEDIDLNATWNNSILHLNPAIT